MPINRNPAPIDKRKVGGKTMDASSFSAFKRAQAVSAVSSTHQGINKPKSTSTNNSDLVRSGNLITTLSTESTEQVQPDRKFGYTTGSRLLGSSGVSEISGASFFVVYFEPFRIEIDPNAVNLGDYTVSNNLLYGYSGRLATNYVLGISLGTYSLPNFRVGTRPVDIVDALNDILRSVQFNVDNFLEASCTSDGRLSLTVKGSTPFPETSAGVPPCFAGIYFGLSDNASTTLGVTNQNGRRGVDSAALVVTQKNTPVIAPYLIADPRISDFASDPSIPVVPPIKEISKPFNPNEPIPFDQCNALSGGKFYLLLYSGRDRYRELAWTEIGELDKIVFWPPNEYRRSPQSEDSLLYSESEVLRQNEYPNAVLTAIPKLMGGGPLVLPTFNPGVTTYQQVVNAMNSLLAGAMRTGLNRIGATMEAERWGDTLPRAELSIEPDGKLKFSIHIMSYFNLLPGQGPNGGPFMALYFGDSRMSPNGTLSTLLGLTNVNGRCGKKRMVISIPILEDRIPRRITTPQRETYTGIGSRKFPYRMCDPAITDWVSPRNTTAPFSFLPCEGYVQEPPTSYGPEPNFEPPLDIRDFPLPADAIDSISGRTFSVVFHNADPLVGLAYTVFGGILSFQGEPVGGNSIDARVRLGVFSLPVFAKRTTRREIVVALNEILSTIVFNVDNILVAELDPEGVLELRIVGPEPLPANTYNGQTPFAGIHFGADPNASTAFGVTRENGRLGVSGQGLFAVSFPGEPTADRFIKCPNRMLDPDLYDFAEYPPTDPNDNVIYTDSPDARLNTNQLQAISGSTISIVYFNDYVPSSPYPTFYVNDNIMYSINRFNEHSVATNVQVRDFDTHNISGRLTRNVITLPLFPADTTPRNIVGTLNELLAQVMYSIGTPGVNSLVVGITGTGRLTLSYNGNLVGNSREKPSFIGLSFGDGPLLAGNASTMFGVTRDNGRCGVDGAAWAINLPPWAVPSAITITAPYVFMDGRISYELPNGPCTRFSSAPVVRNLPYIQPPPPLPTTGPTAIIPYQALNKHAILLFYVVYYKNLDTNGLKINTRYLPGSTNKNEGVQLSSFDDANDTVRGQGFRHPSVQANLISAPGNSALRWVQDNPNGNNRELIYKVQIPVTTNTTRNTIVAAINAKLREKLPAMFPGFAEDTLVVGVDSDGKFKLTYNGGVTGYAPTAGTATQSFIGLYFGAGPREYVVTEVGSGIAANCGSTSMSTAFGVTKENGRCGVRDAALVVFLEPGPNPTPTAVTSRYVMLDPRINWQVPDGLTRLVDLASTNDGCACYTVADYY
jgi:hypothetical protein